MIPKNRDELVRRMLEDLGEPVIKVNLAKEQLENAVDDAIDFWQLWHHESQDHTFLRVEITQEMLDNNAVKLPDSVFAVLQIVNPGAGSGGAVSWMSYEFEMTRDAMFDTMKQSGGGLSSYVMTKQKLADMQHLLIKPLPFDYRYHKRELTVFGNLSDYYSVGSYMLIEVMGFLYKSSHNIWGDQALRKLATAYAKKYWGQNLIKFAGVALPGGTMLNGSEIYQQAMQDIEKAEQHITDLSEPYGIIVM